MHCKRPHKKCRPATRKKKKISFQTWHKVSQSQGDKGCKSGYLPEDREALQTGYCWLADTSMGLKRKQVSCPASLSTVFQEAHSTVVWSHGCSGLSQAPWGKRWKTRQGGGIHHSVFSSIPWVHSLVTTSLRIQSGMEEHSVKILLWSPYRPRTLLPRRVGCSWGFCIPDNWH